MARVVSHCRICGEPLDSSAVAGECLACRTKSTELAPVSHFAETRVDQESANALHGDNQAELKDQQAYLPQAPEGFRILKQVGHGGTSFVFLAEQSGMARHVAIKYLMQFHVFKQGERLEREARALGQLDHPNILKIYNCVLKTANPYLVMEYAAGGSVSDEIKKYQNGLPIEWAKTWAIELASAMVAAHKAGIVHRDLKPGNVLINAEGHLKVADFGLARNLETDPTITKTEAVLGTPAFMSPEQAMGQVPTKACDIYGIGATLYAMVTGRPPHAIGLDPHEAIQKVITDDPTPPGKLRKDLPRDFATIIETCLERSPSKRYATVKDLHDDLVRFRNGENIIARPVTGLTRTFRKAKKHRNWFFAAVAAVAIATALWMVVRKDDNRIRERLNRDGYVELIPEFSSPKRHFGDPVNGIHAESNTLEISSLNPSMLTFTDDIGLENFRVVMTYDYLYATAPKNEQFMFGIVFGHEVNAESNVHKHAFWASVVTNAVRMNQKISRLSNNHLIVRVTPLRAAGIMNQNGESADLESRLPMSPATMTVEVVDGNVTSKLDNPNASIVSNLRRLTSHHQSSFDFKKNRTRSVGIYVDSAHLRIRSFRIEKINTPGE